MEANSKNGEGRKKLEFRAWAFKVRNETVRHGMQKCGAEVIKRV